MPGRSAARLSRSSVGTRHLEMTAAPLRVFVSTGEASGELLAADLIGAMRACGATIDADGIGGDRLEARGRAL